MEAAAEGGGGGGAGDPAGWLGHEARLRARAGVRGRDTVLGRAPVQPTESTRSPFGSGPGNRSQKTLKVTAGGAAGAPGAGAEVARPDGSPGPPPGRVWQA